jgi:hypothetical protein
MLVPMLPIIAFSLLEPGFFPLLDVHMTARGKNKSL